MLSGSVSTVKLNDAGKGKKSKKEPGS